jgi:hypothetical protein
MAVSVHAHTDGDLGWSTTSRCAGRVDGAFDLGCDGDAQQQPRKPREEKGVKRAFHLRSATLEMHQRARLASSIGAMQLGGQVAVEG